MPDHDNGHPYSCVHWALKLLTSHRQRQSKYQFNSLYSFSNHCYLNSDHGKEQFKILVHNIIYNLTTWDCKFQTLKSQFIQLSRQRIDLA